MIYWYLFWMQELQSRSKHSNTSHGPPGHHWIKALPVWPWLTGKLLAPCLKLQIAEANLINSQHATWLMQCPTLYLALSCYHLRKCKICNKMPANAEQQLTVLPWRVVKMAEAFDPRHQMQRLKWDVTLALIHAGFLSWSYYFVDQGHVHPAWKRWWAHRHNHQSNPCHCTAHPGQSLAILIEWLNQIGHSCYELESSPIWTSAQGCARTWRYDIRESQCLHASAIQAFQKV